jgi:hypothetical protein
VLRCDGDRLAFRHDLFREALYDDLPPALRAALHRQAARALSGVGASPQHVGEHLLRGARPGDRQAVEGLHRAALAASGPAPATAVELLEKALELAGRHHPSRDRLLADLAVSLQLCGRFAEVEAICRDAVDRGADAATEGTFRLALIVSLADQGRVQDSVLEADRMVGSGVLTTSERAELRARAAWSRAFLGELELAVAGATVAGAEATESGNESAACTAGATLALVAYLRARYAEAARLAAATSRRADLLTGAHPWRFLLHLLRAHALFHLGPLEAAAREIERGAEVEEEVGGTRFLPPYHQGRAFVAYLSGRWDDAAAELATGLALGDEMGHDNGKIPLHSLSSIISLHRERLRDAERAAVEAVRVFEEAGPQ